jgi:predicted metal-dependent RNase
MKLHYFYNEQGDYTIAVDDLPIAFVKVEDHAKDIVRQFEIKSDQVTTLIQSNNTLYHEKRKLETSIENKDKIMKEMGERFHAKLMSVYYMLGTIKKMGTHHEKSVAVGYVMTTVDDLLKNDPLSWNQDWFGNQLPF